MILARSLKGNLRAVARSAVIAAAVAVSAFVVCHFVLDPHEPVRSNSVAVATDAPRIVFSEFGANADTVWAASADNPSRRTAIATIEHAPEYGIFLSLSPDGRRIAYSVLPPNGGPGSIDAPAELWAMNADGSDRRRLTGNADLPITPVWSPDSGSLVIRRSAPAENSAGSFQLLRVGLSGGETLLVNAEVGVFPVGFSADAAIFYFVRLSPAGTDLGSVPSGGGQATAVARLSDGFARDWHLSADATRLAYLAPASDGVNSFYSARVLDLAKGAGSVLRAAVTGGSGGDFNPIWHPNGRELTVGRLGSTGQPAGAFQVAAAGTNGTRALSPPAKGFDVPLSWSPDGGYLAVRSFEGESAASPGRSWVVLTDGKGERHRLSTVSDIEIAGWIDGGG
jgi:Tol biopolymer transport system component